MPRREHPDPLAAAIGRRLRELRRAQGWKLESLVFEHGGKSKGHLSDLEHGRVMPTVATLAALAGHLRVELLDLVTSPEDSLRHRVVDATRRADPETLQRWLDEAERLPDDRNARPRGLPRVVARPRDQPSRARGVVRLMDLRATAGPRGDERAVEARGWLALEVRGAPGPVTLALATIGRAPDPRAAFPQAFAARVVGRSMEPLVPDGALALFRKPGPGNRRGRLFLVERRGTAAPEEGGAYTVKFVEHERRAGRAGIVLTSLNPEFPPLFVDPEREGARVVAELVALIDLRAPDDG